MVHTGGSCLPPHHQSLIRNGNGSLRMWNKDYGLESPEQLVLPEPAIWTTGVGVILYSVMSNMLGEIRVQPACLFSNEAAGSVLTVVIATSDSQCTGLEMTRSYFCLRPLTHTFVSRVFIDAGQTSISAQILSRLPFQFSLVELSVTRVTTVFILKGIPCMGCAVVVLHALDAKAGKIILYRGTTLKLLAKKYPFHLTSLLFGQN